MRLATLPLAAIRRPLQRQLDEARVRRATADTLRMHLR